MFDSICYPGTHDNDTAVGWFAAASQDAKDTFSEYSGMTGNYLLQIRDILCSSAAVALLKELENMVLFRCSSEMVDVYKEICS